MRYNTYLSIVFIFFTNFLFSQIHLDNSIYQFSEFDDAITIEEIIQKEKEGAFSKPFKIETYKKLTNKQANWICFTVPIQKETQYITIENSLFEEIDFYLVNNSFKKIEEDNSYRYPLIAITKEETPCKIFIRTKDALSFRTEFNTLVINTQQLQKKTEKDYFVIGAYVISLLVLLITACGFFFYKQQIAILWYIAHILLLIIEYLISTGVFSQWVLDKHIVTTLNLDQISLLASTLCIAEFFKATYKFTKKTQISKHILTAISLVCFSGLLFAVFDSISGNIYNVEFYSKTTLDLSSLTALIAHIILIRYRVIPVYLFIAFLLPVSGIIANSSGLKEQFTNPNIVYFIFQSVYIGVLVQVITFIFYTIKQAIDGEFLAISLSKENNELKNNFQEQLTTSQEIHQNALMSDVHDSFGGYIEALKMNLLQKELNNSKINEILESFKTDYRFLLNSLYIPNINSDNFENSIKEYSSKMDSLTPISISFTSKKEEYVKLPQNIAKLIYKAASELTTNAIKYAEPKSIKIYLELNRSSVYLNIKDNGKGFETSTISHTALGLKSLQERVALLNGTLLLESKLNKGTRIIINIPLIAR